MENKPYYITAARLAQRGRESIPAEFLPHTQLIYSSPATLAFNSPGAQGFGVKRAGLAIPGSVMLLVGTCYAFGWVLTNERVALRLTEALLAMDVSLWLKLLMINLALLVVGMFMDSAPAIMLVGPILAPALAKMGVDPIVAGMIVCINLTIGLATPPVGVCLFSATNISRVPFERVSKSALPFLGAVIAVLMIVTYVPWVSLFLVDLIR